MTVVPTQAEQAGCQPEGCHIVAPPKAGFRFLAAPLSAAAAGDSHAARPGQRVKRGQLLGKIGNSGDAWQPHVHFQLAYGSTCWRPKACPA
ncbi:M23 family metallopeptidase [Massilia sp. PAMC28688]|uniref:M23 family metallopeptidase n=1 Tax=Massilia sp. PAMC28688 TaxID=2861283 RepID=UPI0027D9477B|nr:M23 family metallopeptidase [Massilia sp. PAMC28688]